MISAYLCWPACVFFCFARKAVGASCTRHSLRPHLFSRDKDKAKLGRENRAAVPRILHRCGPDGLKFSMMDTSFFVGRVKIVPAKSSALGNFRCKVFEVMHRNALAATDFFRIPPGRVVELGSQTEI